MIIHNPAHICYSSRDLKIKHICKELKTARKASGISQYELAKKINKHRNGIRKIESEGSSFKKAMTFYFRNTISGTKNTFMM